MRYFRIFLLQFQGVIEDRSRVLVWFLLATIAPLVLILFWRGAGRIPGWSPEQITSYYLLAIVLYAIIMCQKEEHIATEDIQEGGLTAYLLKPFSYFRLTFINELCYRLLQGVLGGIMLGSFVSLFPHLFTFTNNLEVLLLSIVIAFLAFFLTFVFKMSVGMLAFWMTETRGAFEAVNVTIVIFSGMLMPITFLPHWLETLASVSPFSYMIYYPVIAFEGRLSIYELWIIIAMQLIWLTVLYLLYRKLWREGLKKYTAVGQ